MKYLKIILYTLLMTSFVGCGEGEEIDNDFNGSTGGTGTTKGISEDAALADYATPSPIELATIMQYSGAKYTPALMNPAALNSNYTTPISKALNMGIYAGDMSYAGVFNHNDRAYEYLQVLQTMSADIGITGAIDPEAMNRLKDNLGIRDSLFGVMTSYYWNSDLYLRENNRSETAALIAAGAWIEMMYLGTQSAVEMTDKPLIAISARLLEQKLTLRNLVLLLKMQPSSKIDLTPILNELIPLNEMFEQIEVEMQIGQHVTDYPNKVTAIVAQSKSSYQTTLIDDIRKQLLSIRTKITSA